MQSRDGAVVRALASHQCVQGSIPGSGVICGLSLLFVLYSAPRGFSWCSVGKQITFLHFLQTTFILVLFLDYLF